MEKHLWSVNNEVFANPQWVCRKCGILVEGRKEKKMKDKEDCNPITKIMTYRSVTELVSENHNLAEYIEQMGRILDEVESKIDSGEFKKQADRSIKRRDDALKEWRRKKKQ